MAVTLCRLVYRSESNIVHGDVGLLTPIFETSVKNNRRDTITGALALPDGKFVQVLEGPESKVQDLMARLSKDPRHSGVAVLGRWPISARLFQDWSMARPDPTPLSDQAFKIISRDGSGAKVVSLLLRLSDQIDKHLFPSR